MTSNYISPIDTNLFLFGENAGDIVIKVTNNDSNSGPLRNNMTWPFFGVNEDTIYVSYTTTQA